MDARLRRFFQDPLNVIALAAGIVWGAVALWGRPLGDYGVETDFYGDVVTKARQWMMGHPVVSGFRGPFYYLLVGVAGTLVQDIFLAGKLLSVLSAAAGLRIAGGLLRRLWDPMVAVCGTLFIAANAWYPWYAIRACTDLVFWLLFVSVLYLLLTDTRQETRRWAWAGVLAGLAWLTRYNGLALLPGAVITAALTQRPLRRGARNVLVFAGAWFVVAAPWALYLWRETGDPLYNTNFRNIATEVFARDPNIAVQGKFWSSIGFQSMREVWAIAPSRVLLELGENLVSHLKHDVLELVNPVWAGIAVIGLYLSFRSWGNRRRLAFAGFGVLTYLALLPVFYNPRFMLPLLPWWAVGVGTLGARIAARLEATAASTETANAAGKATGKGAAKAAAKAAARASRRARFRRWWAVAVLGIIATGVSAKEIDDSVSPAHISKGPPMDLLRLAQLVRSSGTPVGPTTPIAARKPQIGYLLDAPVVSIPFGDMQDLRESGAHYLLVSGMEANQFVGLRPLVWLDDPKKAPDGLRFVARVAVPVGGDGNARAASFYAIENPQPWKPKPERTYSKKRDVIEGLTRLETLRVRLVQWYLVWEPEQPMLRMLDRLSPSAREQPLVLQLRGDIAMRYRDLNEAESYYRKALAADSTSAEPLLRLASVRYLQGQPAGFDAMAQNYAAASGLDATSLKAWWDVGMDYARRGLYAPAMTPFAIAATVQPNDPNFLENLGVALECMGWEQRALAAYTAFLKDHPNDPTISNSLQNLQEKIALREGKTPGAKPAPVKVHAGEDDAEG